MRKPTLIPALVLPLLGAPALAQDGAVPAPAAVASAAVPTAPTAPATPPVNFTWEGLVDTYYMYNFTGDPSTQGPNLRQFDVAANSFSLAYAKLAAGVDTDRVAFRIDLGAGHSAAIINGASGLASPQMATTPGGAPASADQVVAHSMYDNAFVVQQAFGTLKLSPAFTLDAGRFVTSASAEVLEANKNWLYSRSLLFFGVPLLHTGVRFNAQINPALKVQLSLVNGWNNDPDNNVGKTGGVSVIYSPPQSGLTAALTSYFGKEAPGSGGDVRFLVDGVVTKDIGALSVGANVDYLKEGDLWWVGGALMARYFLSDSLNLAVRGELIKSKAGSFAAANEDFMLYEGTAMLGYVVAKHFEVRAEGRGDFANKDGFFAKGSESKKNQFTGTLAFLTYF